MDVLGRFHLELVPFIAQLVNFLIIAFILWRFLIRPLLATMRERQEKISQGITDAEKARRALNEADAERDRILQQASAEAYQLLVNARAEAERLRAAALERAAQDAERLIAEARGNIALERQAMERDVRELSLQLSGRILETAVRGLFTDEEKTRVVSRGLELIGRAARNAPADAVAGADVSAGAPTGTS
jgi:F-type H+-transporting ATPase subunit b